MAAPAEQTGRCPPAWFGRSRTFAAQHGISSPTQIKTDWDFGSYKVRNSAGYTALEMYLFSLTGDLIAGADGTL